MDLLRLPDRHLLPACSPLGPSFTFFAADHRPLAGMPAYWRLAGALHRAAGATRAEPGVRATWAAAAGIALISQSWPDAAQPALREALALREAGQGGAGEPDAADTLAVVHALAHATSTSDDADDNNAETAALLRRAYDGRRRVLGEVHTDTLRSLARLAHQTALMGRGDFGLALVGGAGGPLAAAAAALGLGHPSVMALRASYGALLVSSGRDEEARAVLDAVLPQQRALLGPNHPDADKTAHFLTLCE
jgi:hypothetical protein